MRHIMERFGPYVFSIILTGCMVFKKINYIDSKNLDFALNAVLVVAILTIGFLGVMLPVVFSMKVTSAVMRKIFKLNMDKLFLEYMESTIFLGMAVMLVSVLMYFREDFIASKLYDWIFYIWVLVLLMFLACSFRVIDILLHIIFEKNSVDPEKSRKEETDTMLDFQNRSKEEK